MVHRILHRKKYPSDLTDEQWTILAPLIPPAKQSTRGGRPRTVNMREVLNTLFYLNRSGCQWDMLPHDLLPKSTVYDSVDRKVYSQPSGRNTAVTGGRRRSIA